MRTIAAPLLITPLFFIVITTAHAAFPDIPLAHKDIEAIEYLQDHDIMRGSPRADGTMFFNPDAKLNRAELVTILVRAIGLDIDVSEKDCFWDVHEDVWYHSPVCSAEFMGIISGYPDGSFQPEKTVSKAEALKIIANGLGLEGDVDMYASFGEGSEWYAPYLTLAREWNWFDAARSSMALDAPLTRADVAQLLYRAVITAQDRMATGGLNPFSNDLAASYANTDIGMYGTHEADLLEALYANGRLYRNDRLGFSMLLPKTVPTYTCRASKTYKIVDIVAMENGDDVYIAPAWYETEDYLGYNPDGSGMYGDCMRHETQANADEYYARAINTTIAKSDADISDFIKKHFGEDCGPFTRGPASQNGIEEIRVTNVALPGIEEPSGLDELACGINWGYILKYNPATRRLLHMSLGQDGFFYLPEEDGTSYSRTIDWTMVRTLRMY